MREDRVKEQGQAGVILLFCCRYLQTSAFSSHFPERGSVCVSGMKLGGRIEREGKAEGQGAHKELSKK